MPKDRRLDCHPASFCLEMNPVAEMALAEMGAEARNSTEVASEALVLPEGSPGNPHVPREMDSLGRLHVSVEHASVPDPSYSWAFVSLDGCQDGRMVCQADFCHVFPFYHLMLQSLEQTQAIQQAER